MRTTIVLDDELLEKAEEKDIMVKVIINLINGNNP